MSSFTFWNEEPDKLRHKTSEATRSLILIASPYLPARVKKRKERDIEFHPESAQKVQNEAESIR